MTDQKHKAELFRALHVPGKPLVLFNVWDPGSTKAIAASGAKAVATSSWSVANANGFTDGERVPLALAIDNLRRIVGATDLAVTIDLESGYGDTPESVGETIRLEKLRGPTGLEPAASAVTGGMQVLSTTWKSTDGTVSPWKYAIGNAIVSREVYRAIQRIMSERALFPVARDCGATRASDAKRDETSSTKGRQFVHVSVSRSRLLLKQVIFPGERPIG